MPPTVLTVLLPVLLAGGPQPQARAPNPIPLTTSIAVEDFEATPPWQDDGEGGSISAHAYFGTYVVSQVSQCTGRFRQLITGWAKAYSLTVAEIVEKEDALTVRLKSPQYPGLFIFRYDFVKKPPAARASLVFQPDAASAELKPENIGSMQKGLGLDGFASQLVKGLECVSNAKSTSSPPLP